MRSVSCLSTCTDSTTTRYLLELSNQLWILDAFGHCLEQRDRFGWLATELRLLEEEHQRLIASSALRRQQLELYSFQAQEIDAADPTVDQWKQLVMEHAKLSNLERIKRDASSTYAAMHENEGSILERLHMAVKVLSDLAELDNGLADAAQQVRLAALLLQELAY